MFCSVTLRLAVVFTQTTSNCIIFYTIIGDSIDVLLPKTYCYQKRAA